MSSHGLEWKGDESVPEKGKEGWICRISKKGNVHFKYRDNLDNFQKVKGGKEKIHIIKEAFQR